MNTAIDTINSPKTSHQHPITSKKKLQPWRTACSITGVNPERIQELIHKLAAGKKLVGSRTAYLVERVDGFEDDALYLTALLALNQEYYSRAEHRASFNLFQLSSRMIYVHLQTMGDQLANKLDVDKILSLIQAKRPQRVFDYCRTR